MSKKIKVLALAVVSAAFFALPAMASAQEIHVEPGEAFTVTGPGMELRTAGEPTLTCEGTGGTGKFESGSTTTGTFSHHYTGCHIKVPIFGTTAKCKSETAGGADNTLLIAGTFHLVTHWFSAPTTLETINTVHYQCAGISSVTVSGSVIGTITSPKCGESSKTLGLSFTATENTQNHLEYTGSKFDLVSKTGSGENRTSALVGSVTNTQASGGKLNCT